MTEPIIDVEEVFSDFIEEYGGIVTDRLQGAKRTPNADFIFHESKVVAELKTLKDDPFNSSDFMKSRRKRMRQWLDNGDITLEALMKVRTLGDLPSKCYRDAQKLFTRPIRTHLEKANYQIKTTKETDQLHDYKGLLILVSDGNFLLQPKNIRLALAQLLANPNRFRSISSVLYMTANVTTSRPNASAPARLWVGMYRDIDNMENEVPPAFLDDLYEKWADYFSGVTGIKLNRISEVNESGLSETDFLIDTTLIKRP